MMETLDTLFLIVRVVSFHVIAFGMFWLGTAHPRWRQVFLPMGLMMVGSISVFDLSLLFPESASTIQDVGGWINTLLAVYLACYLICRVISYVRDPAVYVRKTRSRDKVGELIDYFLEESHPGNAL